MIHKDLQARLLAQLAQRNFKRAPVADITGTIQRALAAAGLDTGSGLLKSVTDTIEQSLSAAGLRSSAHVPERVPATIDGVATRVVDAFTDPAVPTPQSDTGRPCPGEFVSRSFSNHAGMRHYKVYVPASYTHETAAPVPMLLMLHGCTQSPDDFASGTRMNVLAEQYGFIAVYPAQDRSANGSNCWNWFRSNDQRRDNGEPALLAGIVREVASDYRIDERRVFVAGLSAGAAMAVILGASYPDLFAAIGAHSGLPYGAAHDLPSAFGAMRGGMPFAPEGSATGPAMNERLEPVPTVPTIVFHGDSDPTVDARNGAAIVHQAMLRCSEESPLSAEVHEGVAHGGRTYRRTVYSDASSRPWVEHWIVHGAGHAWSGGSASGSFTDGRGPDASKEMIRFFYEQCRGGTS